MYMVMYTGKEWRNKIRLILCSGRLVAKGSRDLKGVLPIIVSMLFRLNKNK